MSEDRHGESGRPRAAAADRSQTRGRRRPGGQEDRLQRAKQAWLKSKKPHTRAAYQTELEAYEQYLAQTGISMLAATKAEADSYLTTRRTTAAADSSIVRSAAALSSWYDALLADGAATYNPFKNAERPRLDQQHTRTRYLDESEARDLVCYSENQPRRLGGRDTRARDAIVARLLITLGLRAEDLFALRIGDFEARSDETVLTLRDQGGATSIRTIPADVELALRQYLAYRLGRLLTPALTLEELLRRSPRTRLLITTDTGKPLDRHALGRTLRRLARNAGITQWEQISPHSLRHSFAVISVQRGATLEELQESMGHVDRRPSRRYLRSATKEPAAPTTPADGDGSPRDDAEHTARMELATPDGRRERD